MKHRFICLVCGSSRISPVIRVEKMPACCNVLLGTQAEALSQPTAPVSLTFCSRCGHLFNAAFDEELIHYGEGYESSLQGSERFREYDAKLVRELIERNGLRERTLVEIGCGQGEFLRMLCREGNNRGLGFDPSYRGGEPEIPNATDFKVVRERYGSGWRELDADFICSRHTLEHVEDPVAFLRSLKSLIDRPGIPAFFEVPNGLYTLRDGGIWDLIHEHCSYFTPPSLEKVLQLGGYSSIEIAETFEGQFLAAHAKTGDSEGREEAIGIDYLEGLVADFSRQYQRTIEGWDLKLRDFADRKCKVVLWGAGAKGTAFLNVLRPRNVAFIVDVNTIKHAKYVPVTGQQIVPPEFLKEYRPDAIVVMNPNYRAEIARQVATLGVEAELLCA
jgi:SAM-dependent methyltransferase